MANSSIPNIPGMGAMTDTLDFVKNLWGGMKIPGMGIPGMVMPTLSLEEINKQIADLKTVEAWLTLNMNMLRSTIQALEVQSATITALQSMSDALSAAVKPPSTATAGATATSAKTARPETAPEPDAPAEPPESARDEAPAADTQASNSTPPPLPNPAIWWNMLQDQFKQAVNSALAAESPATAASAADKTATHKADTATESGETAKAAPKKAAPRARKTSKTVEK